MLDGLNCIRLIASRTSAEEIDLWLTSHYLVSHVIMMHVMLPCNELHRHLTINILLTFEWYMILNCGFPKNSSLNARHIWRNAWFWNLLNLRPNNILFKTPRSEVSTLVTPIKKTTNLSASQLTVNETNKKKYLIPFNQIQAELPHGSLRLETDHWKHIFLHNSTKNLKMNFPPAEFRHRTISSALANVSGTVAGDTWPGKYLLYRMNPFSTRPGRRKREKIDPKDTPFVRRIGSMYSNRIGPIELGFAPFVFFRVLSWNRHVFGAKKSKNPFSNVYSGQFLIRNVFFRADPRK